MKHATVARREVKRLREEWPGSAAEFELLADALVGLAVAWDALEVEGTARGVASLTGRYLSCLDRLRGAEVVAEVVTVTEDGDGDGGAAGLDTAGWERLAADVAAGAAAVGSTGA